METGWFKEDPWTLSNNPGGLTRSSGIIKKEDARNLGE
jgi:hypothetical protein